MFKKNLCIAVALVALILGTAGVAQAQVSRLYFAGYLGLNTFNDMQFEESTVPASGDFELDNTNTFAGALGLRLSRNMRLEGELNYHNAELKTVNIAGVGSFDVGGDLVSTIGFLNLYYDIDVPWKMQPFIGGGIGYGWHEGQISDIAGNLTSTTTKTSALAWNIGGGVKYRPRRDLAFTGAYRYVDSMDLEIGSFDIDYGSHEFRMGVEWDFPVR